MSGDLTTLCLYILQNMEFINEFYANEHQLLRAKRLVFDVVEVIQTRKRK